MAAKPRPKDFANEVEEIARLPYTVELEYGDAPKDGVLAYLAEWPDVFATGRSRKEAVAGLEAALRAVAEYRLAQKLSIPRPTSEYGGRVLVQMPRSLHRDAQRRAELEGVSMNQWIATTLARVLGRVERLPRSRARYGLAALSTRKSAARTTRSSRPVGSMRRAPSSGPRGARRS
jgi:predicted HicB family RNase H-like nuclease